MIHCIHVSLSKVHVNPLLICFTDLFYWLDPSDPSDAAVPRRSSVSSVDSTNAQSPPPGEQGGGGGEGGGGGGGGEGDEESVFDEEGLLFRDGKSSCVPL